MQAIVLAAGRGTRMRSKLPKVLHSVHGRPILEHVLDTLVEIGVKNPCVVIGSGAEQVRSFLKSYEKKKKIRPQVVLQKVQRGTGHAVMMCEKALKRSKDKVLIWPGDMPLLEAKTLRAFQKEHQRSAARSSVLSSLQVDPKGYGRILRAGGTFYAIREELDATESERRIQEVNTGVYLFDRAALFKSLRKVKPGNKKNELYLTDAMEVLSSAHEKVEAFPLAAGFEGQGINNKIDLAKAVRVMNQKEVRKHMENGVTVVDPEQTYIEKGVKIAPDTVIYPWTYIESGVRIGEKCKIGPFAKIRKGSVIGEGAIIGSFVEVNRSKVGKNVSAKHLSYLGDATIGEGSNLGAGFITANFDGVKKHKTKIGKKSLIGSNTVLVAPVALSDQVKTGAGAVVTGGRRTKKGEVLVGVPAKPLRNNKGNKK